MRSQIDFVLPTTGNHGWVVSEGWIKSAEEAGLLGKVFRPKAKWGSDEPEKDDGLLQQLLDNRLSETVVVLGMDWHSQPLTKLEKWKSAWRNCQSKIIAIIWEDYTSDFVSQQKQLSNAMENAARCVVECVDWIYSNHEDNISFYQDKIGFKKIGYLPFSADLNIFEENKALNKIYDKLCFKGYIKDFGFKSGPYLQRANLAKQLSDRLGERFVFNKENVSDQEYAAIISKYFFQINLPSFSPSMTARAAEVMAAGNFVFQFKPSGKITNELFKDGREMVFYDPEDFEGLISKINYYFNNLGDAKLIAERGHDKFVKEFSMGSQLSYISSPWKRLGSREQAYSKIVRPYIRKILDKIDIDQVLLPARYEFEFGEKCKKSTVEDLFKRLLYIEDPKIEISKCDFLAIKSLNREDYDAFFGDVLSCLPKGADLVFKDVALRKQTSLNTKALKVFLDLRPVYQKITAKNEFERACLYIRFCMYYYIYTCTLSVHYKILICFADMQPIENFIAQMARAAGLVTVTLQHGLYVDYGDINTVNRVNYEHQPSEYFLAWGSVTADLIRRYHPGNQVVTVGKPDIYTPMKASKLASNCEYITIIMDQHWYDSENIKMLKVVDIYCQSRNIDINVAFHPTNKRELYSNLKISYKTDLDITKSLFIVGHTSSLAYEFMALGLKVFFYKTDTPRLPTDDRIVFNDSQSLGKIASGVYPEKISINYIESMGDESRVLYKKFFSSLFDFFDSRS